MGTTATLIIDYGSDESALLQAELDTERNNDKTSFMVGDIVFFRVYHSVPYTITTSSGSVTLIASDEVELINDEVISFVQSKTASVQKKCINVVNTNWYDSDGGNSYGVITPIDHLVVSAAGADDNALGIAKIDYNTEYDVWSITCPISAPADYSILILVKADS